MDLIVITNNKDQFKLNQLFHLPEFVSKSTAAVKRYMETKV